MDNQTIFWIVLLAYWIGMAVGYCVGKTNQQGSIMKNSTVCIIIAAFGFAANIYQGGDDALGIITMMMVGFGFVCNSIERK